MNPIRFRPIYQERVWGGRALAERLGHQLPGSAPIGESWELVDRPDAQSVDEESQKTLRELIIESPESLMGPGFDPDQSFPVLVKWLDCSKRLSLQVHPPNEVAGKLGGEPKAECWYVADTTGQAALIVGLKSGTSRGDFEQAICDQALEPLLHRFPVEAGTSMMLNAGRLHAIDAGNLILEIQQNSDTTYRVYDWGRKGLDGKPRDLHIDQSLESIDFDDFEPSPELPFSEFGEKLIAECPEFRIRQMNLREGQSIQFPANEQPRILSVVAGRLSSPEARGQFRMAENVLLPYAWGGSLVAESPSRVLITDRFV